LNKKIVLFFGFWILFAVSYSVMAIYLHEIGYANLDSLFISHQYNLMFNSEVSKIKTFFLSYPLLTHILVYPAGFFSVLQAPVITSVVFMSLFSASLVALIASGRLRFFEIVFAVYFLISPLFIYAAVSGSSFYAFLIGFYLLYYYLFKYIQEYTTYRLTILSLVFSLMVFLNYKMLWLIALLIPLLFLFSRLLKTI
jgi:hypothetical protein